MSTADFGDRLLALADDCRRACDAWLTWKDADPLLWDALPPSVRIHRHPVCRAIKADPRCLATCRRHDQARSDRAVGAHRDRCPHGVIELREAVWQGNEFQGLLCCGAWRYGPRPEGLPSYPPRRATAVWRLIRSTFADLLPMRQALASGLTARARADALIATALDLIEARLSAELRVATIARCVDLSPSRFAHRFREACGISFGRYLQSRLMREAARRLALPRQRVIDVALDLGFATPDHFAALFKRHSGMAPSRFSAEAAERGA